MSGYATDPREGYPATVSDSPQAQAPIPPPEGAIFTEDANYDDGYVGEFPEMPGLPTTLIPIPTLDPGVSATGQDGEIVPKERLPESWALHGPFDAYVARVVGVHYGDATPPEGVIQSIDVIRCEIRWDTQTHGGEAQASNELLVADKPMKFSEPTPIIAHPWPAQFAEDQQGYHVAIGDVVTVLSGRDGQTWYLHDDEPFLARVIYATSGEESNAGGAGTRLLKVRRQNLWGDPDDGSYAGPVASNAYTYDGSVNYADYEDVLVLAQPGQQAGYRIGDMIWVLKRGRYYFAIPNRESFPAVITNAGPDSEADETTNFYWLKEVDFDVDYVVVGGFYNKWTIDSTTARAKVHPEGYSGRYGRWILAKNLAESDTEPIGHLLATDETIVVIVNQFADVKSPIAVADPRSPIYFFSYEPPPHRWGVANAGWSAGNTYLTAQPCRDWKGTDENGALTVYVFIFTPLWDAGTGLDLLTPDGLDLGAGNGVIAYLPISDSDGTDGLTVGFKRGILLSAALRLPPGGDDAQLIEKKSDTSYDYGWGWARLKDIPAVPPP